jgi:hypothetical protein
MSKPILFHDGEVNVYAFISAATCPMFLYKQTGSCLDDDDGACFVPITLKRTKNGE